MGATRYGLGTMVSSGTCNTGTTDTDIGLTEGTIRAALSTSSTARRATVTTGAIHTIITTMATAAMNAGQPSMTNPLPSAAAITERQSTRLNSSHQCATRL